MTLLGIIIFAWFVIGITIAGYRYPGYSHRHQFCSELGAVGSPTEYISPTINNYPLGLLFILFALLNLYSSTYSPAFLIMNLAIALHGIATWLAGFFAMDKDPYTDTPSSSGNIHTLAGIAMLATLLIAPLASFWLPYSVTFKAFTVLCILMCCTFSGFLKHAYEARENVGLYQRLSYGAQLMWLAGLGLQSSF